MENQNINDELLEMKEQLRNMKQQLNLHTNFLEEKLRDSIDENTHYFKRQMRKYLYSVIFLACIFLWTLCVELTEEHIDLLMMVILMILFAFLVFFVWELIRYRKQFQLHKLAELDLLSAQTKMEQYKNHKTDVKKCSTIISIVALPILYFSIYQSKIEEGSTPGEAWYELLFFACMGVVSGLVGHLLDRRERKKISTLLSDIEELKSMDR